MTDMSWHTVELEDRSTGEQLTTQDKAANQEFAEIHVDSQLRQNGDSERLRVKWSW